jgi:hypothetical protein
MPLTAAGSFIEPYVTLIVLPLSRLLGGTFGTPDTIFCYSAYPSRKESHKLLIGGKLGILSVTGKNILCTRRSGLHRFF